MAAPIAPPRRRRLRLFIAAAVVVSVAAVAAVYFLFFTGDSPPPLTLSTPVSTVAASATTATSAVTGGTTATTAAGATAAPVGSLDGTWSIGGNSVAGYRVREKLAALPAQSDAVGRTSSITGSIQVSHQGGQLTVANGASFQVDVSTLKSDESMRDNRIRTMGLETNRFPKATFVSTAPITLPASAESGQAAKTEVTGDLTIHGVTKQVTIPLDTQVTGGRIEVVGSLSFPFSDYGMTAPSLAGFVTVTNTATLEFQLFFDKK